MTISCIIEQFAAGKNFQHASTCLKARNACKQYAKGSYTDCCPLYSSLFNGAVPLQTGQEHDATLLPLTCVENMNQSQGGMSRILLLVSLLLPHGSWSPQQMLRIYR